jgi:hypothetical protein
MKAIVLQQQQQQQQQRNGSKQIEGTYLHPEI